MVKPPCSNFLVEYSKFSGVQIFISFMVRHIGNNNFVSNKDRINHVLKKI